MALESGKKVISLFVNHSNEGIIHSILKKKTICHTSIESVCNNIRKEYSILTDTDDAPIPNIADKLWIRQCRKVKKKRYILLIVIELFVY